MSAGSQATQHNRSDHMKFLMEELQLDHAAAMLLYRAERLQEKGQLHQALYLYNELLEAKPDLQMASVNARMIEDMLTMQQMQADNSSIMGLCRRRLRRGARGNPAPNHQHLHQHQHLHPPPINPSVHPVAVADVVEATQHEEPVSSNGGEMDVFWSAQEEAKYDFYPNADVAALEAAAELVKVGSYMVPPLLKLVSNEVTDCTCNADTDYQDFLSGRAVVRVTFPPGARPKKRARSESPSEAADGKFSFVEQAVILAAVLQKSPESSAPPQAPRPAPPGMYG